MAKRVTAETLSRRQREISVSEFFAKNRHLLGFDSLRKALLTTVKEAVDNSLDACEEAGILPEIRVELEAAEGQNRYIVRVTDNGPGIVETQAPRIFGQLLYGSKFHSLKQSRGQQGIGISAAAMYGQLTTGKPVSIVSRTGARSPAYAMQVVIDTNTNKPKAVGKKKLDDWHLDHGTRVELELEAQYLKGRQSVEEFLHQVAVANPHATLHYRDPHGAETDYVRGVQSNPEPPSEIKPHPHGVELGVLMKMLQSTKHATISQCLSPRLQPGVAPDGGGARQTGRHRPESASQHGRAEGRRPALPGPERLRDPPPAALDRLPCHRSACRSCWPD